MSTASRFPYEFIFQILTMGRFLLVKFQLDYVIKKESPRAAIKALDSLPTDMNAAYIEVLDRIERANAQETALKILSWLFHARRSLRMEELQEVLSIETDPPDTELMPEFFLAPERIIKACQGLVESDETNGIVRFTHYSVQEFLEKMY